MAELTPVKAIRAFCLQCTCEDKLWIRQCPSKDCPLHKYRMGRNPNRKKKEESACP